MFKAYQWNNPQLKKKARFYDILTWTAMVMVLVLLYLGLAYVSLVFAGFGILSLIFSWRMQGKDRSLKKPKS